MAEHNPPRPQTWQAAFELIRDRGHEHRAEPDGSIVLGFSLCG